MQGIEVSQAGSAWRLISELCRDRVCQGCVEGRNLGQLLPLTPLFAEAAANGEAVLFITLTQRRIPWETLGSAHARLDVAIKRLRRAKPFTRSIGACVARFERVPDRVLGWHEHAHLVVIAHDLDEASLVRAWRRSTDDSEAGLRIKPLLEHQVRDYLAYIGKPDTGTADDLLELATALKGTHDVRPNAACRRGRAQLQAVSAVPRIAWPDAVIVSVAELKRRAREGDRLARAAVAALQAKRCGAGGL